MTARWLETGGLRIGYRSWGSGQPLLLLNGLTRSVDTWEEFTAAFPGRRTVAFDMPGVGRSPAPAFPLSIPRLARIAAEVLDAVEVDTVDVVGFSHGGLVAQQLAFDDPARVRRLVLAATSCGAGGVVAGQLMVASTWSSVPFLGAITQPTLVVRGAYDRLVPPENGAMLARRIPGARLVTLPTGHDLQRPDRAGLFARAVECFFADEVVNIP